MSPHKPDPPSRKVEVDLSGILIRPEGLERGALENNTESANSVPVAWKHWAIGERQPRISSSGWVNILFAIGSCLVGFYCTVFMIDSFEHSHRRAHPPAEVAYRRPEPNATTSKGFRLDASRSAPAIQLDQTKINLSDHAIADSNQTPTLSTPQPFRDNQRFALSPNVSGDGAFTNDPTSARSSGAGPDRMSQETSSSAETKNDNERVTRKQSRTRSITRHPRASILSSRIKVSNCRQIFRSSLNNSQPTRTGLKSGDHNGQGRSALTQSPSGRSPMSMHATARGIATMQNDAPMNCMRMQNGMIAQPAAGAGLGGLSGAGLGGGGHVGANARR
jgi:hypothetical protein